MDIQSQVTILEQENSNLKKELVEKSDFISVMVHQLRTPLSANKWIFKMMLDGDLGAISDEQKKIIHQGFESNEQMIRMLAEISHANHVSQWSMHFTLEQIDLLSCITTTKEMFIPEAKEKGITVTYTGPKTLPPVSADHEKTCLMIQNIVENSIKYNKLGGSVTIHAEIFKDKLVVSVHDTGIGIPYAEQKSIGTKFFRASNAKTASRGTGLGLFVVQKIIEGNHGTFWFESTESVGTTFFVSFPLAKES